MKTWIWGALVAMVLAGAWGTYHQLRARTLAEGRAQVAEAALEPLQAELSASEALRGQIEVDAVLAIMQADSAVDEAESRAREVRIVYREAEVRATAAGDSLAASLDSLAAVVPNELVDMVAVAARQHEAERLANREALNALMAEIAETQLQVSLEREARLAWEARYAALEESFGIQARALDTARTALSDRTEQAEGPWYGSLSRVGLVLGGIGLGVLVSQ